MVVVADVACASRADMESQSSGWTMVVLAISQKTAMDIDFVERNIQQLSVLVSRRHLVFSVLVEVGECRR